MSKYPGLPEHVEKALEDVSIPLIDIMHGWLKVIMLETEGLIHETWDLREVSRLDAYMDALVRVYQMSYILSIERAALAG